MVRYVGRSQWEGQVTKGRGRSQRGGAGHKGVYATQPRRFEEGLGMRSGGGWGVGRRGSGEWGGPQVATLCFLAVFRTPERASNLSAVCSNSTPNLTLNRPSSFRVPRVLISLTSWEYGKLRFCISSHPHRCILTCHTPTHIHPTHRDIPTHPTHPHTQTYLHTPHTHTHTHKCIPSLVPYRPTAQLPLLCLYSHQPPLLVRSGP